MAKLVEGLNAGSGSILKEVEVVVAPTFVHVPTVQQTIKAPIKVAAQNCWTGKGGAFTGEVAAEMLTDLGVGWVILGHSERRALCGESSEVVGQKCEYALSQGLKVIACIGETLQQRESGEMYNVLGEQLQGIASHVKDWSKIVIAYEPVWAIGTGVVATPQQAEEVHEWVRQWITKHVSADVTATLRILYGGSVNDANCSELAQLPDVDGFLVGGASLKADSFLNICNALAAVKV